MDTFQLTGTPSAFERFLLASNNTVVDAFFARWPVDLVLRLRALNTSVFCVVEAYRVRTWNPVTILIPFFSDARDFLHTLDECDGVVSGSQVIRLLQRHPFPDTGSDLDVFLPRHGLMKMGQWLKMHGYEYQASGSKHELFDVEAIRSASVAIGVNPDGTKSYPSTCNASHFATHHFTRQVIKPTPSGPVSETYLVQLVVVDPAPVQYIISNFHSTGVMNWFTGKKVISLFPRSTFVDRISYVSRDINHGPEDWMLKYRERGFEVVAEGDKPTKDSEELAVWERYVGDAHMWIVPFDVPDCRFLLPSVFSRKISGYEYRPPPIRFEVLLHDYGVAPSGAYVRVGIPFVYSALAFVMGGVDLSGTLHTNETSDAFL